MRSLARTTSQLRCTSSLALCRKYHKPSDPHPIQLHSATLQREISTDSQYLDGNSSHPHHPFPPPILPSRDDPQPDTRRTLHRYPTSVNLRPRRMDNTFDTALLSLLSSNVQWADQVKAKDPDFFVNSAKAQTPKILWLGCADSRVPESVVTASAPGDIFVHRNIANQFHSDDASALSVLQFAVESVGVQHVIVAGHTNCGGAEACYDLAHSQSATPPPILTTHLGRWLSPLVSLAGELGPLEDRSKAVSRLIEKNVKMQVQTICETETIRKAWSNGKNVRVHGWIYALETGILRDLDISQGLERAI